MKTIPERDPLMADDMTPAVSCAKSFFVFVNPRFRIAFVLAAATLFTGCVGFVGGGYNSEVIVPGPPEVYVFGGGYERGRVVHDYSHRGFVSRRIAHPAPGRRR